MRVHYVCIHGNCIKLCPLFKWARKKHPKSQEVEGKEWRNEKKDDEWRGYAQTYNIHNINIWNIRAASSSSSFAFALFFLRISETNLRTLGTCMTFGQFKQPYSIKESNRKRYICFVCRRIYLRVGRVLFYAVLCYATDASRCYATKWFLHPRIGFVLFSCGRACIVCVCVWAHCRAIWASNEMRCNNLLLIFLYDFF